MKKAEDFRKAFGPATPGFESVVKKTMKELRAQEIKPVVNEWRRWRRPVFAMALALVLFVGFVAINGTLNPFNRTDRIRSEEEGLYTAQPITTALSMGAGQEEGDGDGAAVDEEDETAGLVEHVFWGFMSSWAENDTDSMLNLSADEWKAKNQDAAKAMENLRASGKPRGYKITGVSGGQDNPVRMIHVVVQWKAEDGSYTWNRYEIAVRREEYRDYQLYRIDPDGFGTGEPADAVPEEEMVLLDREGMIRASMEMHYSGIRYDDLIPLNRSVEKSGIRVELVSGCVKGKEACFIANVQDPEGKYAGFELEPSMVWNDDYSSQGGMNLYSDQETNETTYLIRLELSDLVPTEGGSLVAGFDSIRVNENSDRIDLLPLLKEHGRTEEGVTPPRLEKHYGDVEVPKDLKVFNYRKSQDIPLFRDVCLAGIGWIDGRLHVQLHKTGLDVIDMKNGRASAYSAGVSCYVNDKADGSAYNDYSPLNWDGNSDGWPEWSEYVFNCQPEDVDRMELEASVCVTDKILEDDWSFEIPMDLIRVPADPETAGEAEDDSEVRTDYNLKSFMYEWAQGNWDTMQYYVESERTDTTTTPIWTALKEKLSFARPLNYQVNSVSATEDSNIRKLTFTILADQGNGEEPQYQRCEMILRRTYQGQAPDPLSLVILGPAESDPAAKTYDLSKETIFNYKLAGFSTPRELVPVSGVSCEKDGIRAELLSGYITSHEVWYVYSVEDTEKQFDDYNWNVDYAEDSVGSYNSFQEGELYHDPEKHQSIRMGHYGYTTAADLTDRTVKLTLHTVRIGSETKPGQWTLEFPLSAIIPEENAAAGEPVRLDRKKDYNQMLLWDFFQYWAQDDVENMVYSLTPEDILGGQETVAQLRELMESGTPLSYQINSRRDENWGSVYTCTVEMDPGNGEESRYERFDFRMMKSEKGWFSGIDLNSVKERQPAEKDPALETISLTREAIIRDYMDYFCPGVRERLQPIGRTNSNNGIRMELISGLVDGAEVWIFCSVEDIEKKYDNYQLEVFSLEDDTGTLDSFSTYPVYGDKAEHKYYFLWNRHNSSPVDTTARDICLRLDYVDGKLQNRLNLTELLEQYGKTVEGIQAPANAWSANADLPESLKVLDYHKPLDIQLLPNATITGIGWIDDQLHVQICINHLMSNSIIFSETAEGESRAIYDRQLSYSPADWVEDGKNYMEYVFDYKPGDEKEITLAVSLSVTQENILGPWEFRFPLEMICPDVKDGKSPEEETDDEAVPVEKLEEEFGNTSLEDREGKITFDVYANTDVYTKNGIGYALREDGTAEAVATSILASGIEEIKVPEKVNGHIVTTIGTGAFMDWSVKSVILPDTVQIIRNCAFEDCDKLQYLRIPDGVTSIEPSVFLNCISLTDVTIPDSVTVIGDQAFSSCRSLTKVGIPEGTVEIGNYAFVGCESLTSVTLPEGLNTLGEYAFFRCAGLETIEAPGGLSFLGQGAFKDCTGLKTARLQEGITLLNPDVFAGCAALETVDLPQSLSSISDRAFQACGSLKKLVLPEGLRYVGRAAFMDCTGLEEVVIPESVIDMEENVFKGCTGLTCTVANGSCAMRYCEENGIPYVVK